MSCPCSDCATVNPLPPDSEYFAPIEAMLQKRRGEHAAFRAQIAEIRRRRET